MIEITEAQVYRDTARRDVSAQPAILSNERAVLDCGCMAIVGYRLDNGESAMAAIACSPEHHELIERYYRLLVTSLDAPTDRPLVEVCDELLAAAADA